MQYTYHQKMCCILREENPQEAQYLAEKTQKRSILQKKMQKAQYPAEKNRRKRSTLQKKSQEAQYPAEKNAESAVLCRKNAESAVPCRKRIRRKQERVRSYLMIYDISQPVFGCSVYPGDPAPERNMAASIENGDLYNMTVFFDLFS